MIDNTTFATYTAEYHTLGCKLNFAETSTIGQLLAEKGVRRAHAGEVPDICVVNTCSVTEEADKKCRQLIRRLVRKYPDALMVVTGCYAQLKAQEISQIEGVDIVLGSDQKLDVANYVERWMHHHKPCVEVTPLKDIHKFCPSCSRGDRTRYFLKVQDGCDYYCTYCTIPRARGRSRSGTIEQLVAQARQVADEGGKEIVITGVNIGDFGKNTGEKFIDLVRELDKVEGIERYRISSLEPDLATDELIEYCASSRAFMPHFHIPLQSGSDEVLRLMHRRYDTRLFADRIAYVRRAMPDAFIGVDVIVGTRGETEELFAESLQFMSEVDVSQYHVFSYSERPGTRALQIHHVVSSEEKHERSQQVLALSQQKWNGFYERFRGTSRPVLLEHSRHDGVMHGFTDNYIRVSIPSQGMDNQIVQVQLGDWDADGNALKGTVL